MQLTAHIIYSLFFARCLFFRPTLFTVLKFQRHDFCKRLCIFSEDVSQIHNVFLFDPCHRLMYTQRIYKRHILGMHEGMLVLHISKKFPGLACRMITISGTKTGVVTKA